MAKAQRLYFVPAVDQKHFFPSKHEVNFHSLDEYSTLSDENKDIFSDILTNID
jgi:hypothetical protein